MNTQDGCIFCKIVAGDIPSDKVHEDEHYLAFKDANPKAPVHLLIIPKSHSERLDALWQRDGADGLGALFEAVLRTAEAQGLEDFRVSVNVGAGAGQEVFHTHVHLLSQGKGKM